MVVVRQVLDQCLPNANISSELIPDQITEQLADPDMHKPAILGAGVWAIIVQDGMFTNELGIAYQPSELEWLIYGGGVKRSPRLIMGRR